MSKAFGAFTETQKKQLIDESIHFLSSYFGKGNNLIIHEIEGGETNEWDDDAVFSRYIQMRILLARWLNLKKIIYSIDSLLSSSYEQSIEEFRGKINGTLLISRYIERRRTNSLDRRFPCLVSAENFNTPENVFLYQILLIMYRNLRSLTLPKNTAEHAFRQKAIIECNNMLRHSVFEEVKKSSLRKLSLQSLAQTVRNRNQRGQTGNTKKYRDLLAWFDFSVEQQLHAGVDKLEVLFGSGAGVWDKIFEIWVLKSLTEMLEYTGRKEWGSSFELNTYPLENRKKQPIAEIRAPGMEMDIYYQNSQLLKGAWAYEGIKALRGIPDLLLEVRSKEHKLILLDVKNIFYSERSDGNTEKYKMLGYFENFRDSIGHEPIGVLLFRNDRDISSDHLTTGKGAALHIHTISPQTREIAFKQLAQLIWEIVGKLD